jgi:hypothetical protein
MSSSRSIAAARNRRAIEQQQPNLIQRSRPNTSIASQPAFSQSQSNQSSQQYQQQYQQKRNNISTKPLRNFQSGQVPGSVPVAVNKISVSDAIGLITIRLGRVEQYMQNLDEQGYLNNASSGNENKSLQNKEIIDNLIERIYFLENKKSDSNAIDNNLVDKLKNNIFELEKEINLLKDIIKNQMDKLTNLTIETENKFSDIENAFVEMEKKDTLIEGIEDTLMEGIEDTLMDGKENNVENIQLIMKENLEQENDLELKTIDLKKYN